MEAPNEDRLCSLNRCASKAVDHDIGDVGPWVVTVFYCREHARQLREGTPLGPVGIDSSRVLVEPTGTTEPVRPSRFPGID